MHFLAISDPRHGRNATYTGILSGYQGKGETGHILVAVYLSPYMMYASSSRISAGHGNVLKQPDRHADRLMSLPSDFDRSFSCLIPTRTPISTDG